MLKKACILKIVKFVARCFFGENVARVVWKVAKSSNKTAELATLDENLLSLTAHAQTLRQWARASRENQLFPVTKTREEKLLTDFTEE